VDTKVERFHTKICMAFRLRGKPTAADWAKTAQMMREYLAKQSHAPADPATREAAVQRLIYIARKEPPIQLTEQVPLALQR
jgi:hypothetical protein